MSLDRLPFGWAFSPYICKELLGRVVCGIVPEVVYLVHYLDDCISLSCDRDLLEAVTATVATQIREPGFLVSSNSALSSVQVLQALGKIVNLKERFIQVQLFVFLQLMVVWLRLATCGYSKKQLDKLLGTLQWHLWPRRGFSGVLAEAYASSSFGPVRARATPPKVPEGMVTAITPIGHRWRPISSYRMERVRHLRGGACRKDRRDRQTFWETWYL